MQIKLCDLRKDNYTVFLNNSLKKDYLHIAYVEDWPDYKNGDIVAAICHDKSVVIYDDFKSFIFVNDEKLYLATTKFSIAQILLTKK